ncbi:MAG: protein O-mannosyl-transferase [Verrucomicrobiota bacterium]|jgi:tetratricopeptide (TPR) repeat protein
MSRRSKKATVPKTSAATLRIAPGTRTGESRRTGSKDGWFVFGICAFLAVITWVVFGQTIHFQFINYDDNEYVFRNAQVARGLTLEGAGWAFTHVHSANWHPITWLSHMLDGQLYGLNPGGHHFTNVLVHAATAVLLFLVLRQMTGALWRSAFVAALFAIHPLRAESVAWVAERKDVLSGLFFMLIIGAYIRYARGSWSLGRYAVVFALFAVGLMCKPMLVTVPFVLLLLDYWPLNRLAPEGRLEARPFLEKLPLLGLSLASCAVTVMAQRSAIQTAPAITFPMRLGNAVIAYVDYLRSFFWPSDLAILYPWDAARIGWPNIILAALILGAISAGVFMLRRRRYLVTGWLWYLIMLGPVIGILQVGNQARADRYTYLPQIGLGILLTWGASELCARWRFPLVVPAGFASVILACLIFTAHAQTATWQESETVWVHALACTTDNTIAEENLGGAYHDKGNIREAMMHFERSLLIEPRSAAVHSHLGVCYLEMGRLDESLSHLETALAIAPNLADAHYNIGNTYLELGRAKEALTHYDKALQIDPDDTEALNNMAWTLATWPDALLRDGAKAVERAERADTLTMRKNSIIRATLAAAYAEAGRFADAIRTAQQALELAAAEGNASRADSIKGQLALYQSSAAYRDRRFSSRVP